MKLLQWDGNGLWLHYKRLEKGTFKIPRASRDGTARVTRADLAMLLEGIELQKGRITRRFADVIDVQKRAGDGGDDRATSAGA